MTTAYIAQVENAAGTLYVGRQGRLSKVPVFWQSNSVGHLKRYLRRDGGHTYYGRWSPQMAAQTTILKTEGLEDGLRKALVVAMTHADFMGADISAKAELNNPKAVYVIKKADGTFITNGYRRKTPRLFDRAGLLRSYMTTAYQPFKTFAGATVLEIEYGPDGLTPTKKVEHKALEFWLRSPSTKEYAARRYKSELSTFRLPSRLATNEHV